MVGRTPNSLRELSSRRTLPSSFFETLPNPVGVFTFVDNSAKTLEYMSTYGAAAEERAAAYLQANGHRLVARNFQYYGRGRGRRGEIDLVSECRGRLHFVEVKARRNLRFGHPLAAVTPAKVQTLRATAEYFLLRNPQYRHHLVQLDVVTILGEEVRYYPRAF